MRFFAYTENILLTMFGATSSEISWLQASVMLAISGTGVNPDLDLISESPKSLENAAKLTWMSNAWMLDYSKF